MTVPPVASAQTFVSYGSSAVITSRAAVQKQKKSVRRGSRTTSIEASAAASARSAGTARTDRRRTTRVWSAAVRLTLAIAAALIAFAVGLVSGAVDLEAHD